MKKLFCILFIAVFFAMCLAPSAGLLIKGPGEPAANEVPAMLPSVKSYDGSWNLSYFSDLRDYVGKGFYLRLPGITAWDTLAARLFGTSENDGVLLGEDDWLFDAVAADELSGAALLSDREIWCAARSLYLMREYAVERGASLLFVVSPGKYRIYTESAQDYVTVAEGRNLDRLYEALDEQGVSHADLTAPFLQAGEELYWHGDVHWNGKGAALGADTILASLGRQSDFYEKGFVETEEHKGDIYSMLYPTGPAREKDYAPAEGFGFTVTSNYHSADDMTITTENGNAAGSLLMFRDSFGRSLYPYMAEWFGKAYFSRMNNYDLTLIDETEADAVVIELVESTIYYLLKYPAVYPAPEREASVLDGAVRADSELDADTTGMTSNGCVKLTGTLPETPVDAIVYVRAGGTVYEAIPNEGSFTAWIPQDADISGAEVYYTGG